MKLLEKYNRLNITATILTFVVGSCLFYFLLNYILIHQMDETLRTEQQEITSYTGTHNTLPEIIPTKDQYTTFEQAKTPAATSFYTTKNRYDKEEEDLREIKFTVQAGGKYYLVKVSKPLEETEALLQVIIGVTIAMIALILLIGYLINRTVIRRLWQPFYETIDRVNTYHLSEQETPKLQKTQIDEFSLLNEAINKMVGRVHEDYESLKNFTGQAAHEIQTPLAVIRTRLELLMQNESTLENNAPHIVDIEKAVQRLSRLHQSLLLLTKVEHKQFSLNEDVVLNEVIRDKCTEYAEIAESMRLIITFRLQPVILRFHHHLAEILVNNLVSNAIRYNITGGAINITLNDRGLTISNTSASGKLDDEKVFKRFYRSNTLAESNGLGLSIVKQICDMAGYAVVYEYLNEQHLFTITFN